MKLEQYIALHLAFIVCLSSFMLGLGQGDLVLPIFTLIGAVVSLWVVDFKKLFHLGPVWSNILILLILVFSIGYLTRAFDASFGGSLFAVAILRVLVFFQLVLLFRKKENRTCWNIIMVSFLEVIVASVFQQTVIFGLLMIVYLFAALTVVTLMHLSRDRNYFSEHVFLRSLFRASWKGVLSGKGLLHLIKNGFAAMFSGPLAIIAGFRGKAQSEKTVAVASLESSGVWEVSSPVSLGGTKSLRDFHNLSPGRWPLSHEKATFSGSSGNRSGMIGVDREFYYRLIISTVASLVVGLLIFFLTPRQDFRISQLQTRGESWRNSTQQSVAGVLNTVGFHEEIRLGSLGTVLDNPAEVMSAVFTSQDMSGSDADAAQPQNYTAIQNESVYFRGVVLPNYDRGRWTGGEHNMQQVFRQRMREIVPSDPAVSRYFFQRREEPRFEPNTFADRVDFPIDSDVDPAKQPSAMMESQDWAKAQFQPGTQLVVVNCEYTNPFQGIVFSVWPYFLSDYQASRRFAFFQDRIVNEFRENRFAEGSEPPALRFNFMTYAFQNGRQVRLIPCQEPLDIPALLAFDESRLPTIAKVAEQWDSSSQNRNMIERAQNLEHRFLTDERYYYALGGIKRSSSLDPLEDFVRDHPGGHCEYFAGALAMMLRRVGIPSRVVVGYRMDAEIAQQGNDRYIVRQSDAHSWVEAYIPPDEIPESLRSGPYADWWTRGGWLRLDPTAPLRDVIAQTGFWASLKYRSTGFWNDYIMNFNASRQESAIYFPIANFFTSMKERFFDAEYWQAIGKAVVERYASIFREIRKGNWQGGDLLLLGIPLVIVFLICYLVYRMIRLLIREWHSRELSRKKRQLLVTVEFYRQFEKILQKIGLIRKPTETQREFATRANADILTMVDLVNFAEKADKKKTVPAGNRVDDIDSLPRAVADAFYRVRYGDRTLTHEEADEITTVLRRLETAVSSLRMR